LFALSEFVYFVYLLNVLHTMITQLYEMVPTSSLFLLW